MDKRTLGHRGLLAGGVAICLAGMAHAVGGWPPLADALRQEGADGDLISALALGWLFGSAAMLTCGAIVLAARADLKRGGTMGAVACRCVGLLYLLFGVAAFAYRFPNPHFLGFVVLGMLVLVAARAAVGH